MQANQAIPFPGLNGIYNGTPLNDEAAINEVQRISQEGVQFIVIASPAFWWLDYYKEWHKFLQLHFSCTLKNEYLVVYEMFEQRGEEANDYTTCETKVF
jgi:hypothetical protein